MIDIPKDSNCTEIHLGDVLHMPGDNDSRLVVDGFVVLPTYRSNDYDRSCVITRPDLWEVVESHEAEKCPYCEGDGKEIIDVPAEHGADMLVYVDSLGQLLAESNTVYGDAYCVAKASVNFCPMCGRDLRW